MEEEPILNLQVNTPENRRESAERVLEFMERTGMMAVLNDPAAKKKFFQEDLDAEKAEELLSRLNGIITGQPIHEREMYMQTREITNPADGEILYSPPHPAIQKDMLAREVIPTIKKLPLSEAGKYAATQIVLLHSFPDGNGRLARLIELIMRPGSKLTSTEEGLEQIASTLTSNKGAVNWNTMHIATELDKLVLEMPITKDPLAKKIVSLMVTNFKVPEVSLEQYESMGQEEKNQHQAMAVLNEVLNTNRLNGFVALREFLFLRKGAAAIEYLVRKPGEKEEYMLNTQKLINEMTLEDIDHLATRLDTAKVIRMKLISGMYLNPYAYKSPEPGLNLKEYYEREAIDFARKGK
jgi:Fic/DOC family